MNWKTVLRILGRILLLEGVLMLIPLAVSMIYGEEDTYGSFAIPIIALVAVGGLLSIINSKNSSGIYIKEGFMICGLAWIFMSAFGAIPFVLSGVIPNYIDAFFETVSGFTTTGSTVLSKIEGLPKGILFWRSFTVWLGGMGVLSFLMAIIPKGDTGAMYMMRAETPGPKAGKLVSKLSNSSRILYGIYFSITLAMIISLLCCGLGVYDSVVTSLACAGTGGFSVMDASIAGYNSVAVEYVVGIFMLLFSVNFNLYYFILIKKFSQAFFDEELRWLLGITVVSTGAIMLNIYHLYNNFEQTFRYAFFQVGTIVSTSGFVTADFEKWPAFSKTLMLLLMFCGGCAGSTAGGIKVARVMIYFKEMVHGCLHTLHPRRIMHIRISKKAVNNDVLRGVNSYFIVYSILIVISIMLVSIQASDIITPSTAVISCFNNIGPGMGDIVGATGNFGSLTAFQKLVLSFDMLAGRLEIFPMLLLFFPSAWKNN